MEFRSRQAMYYSKQNRGTTGTPSSPTAAASALSPSPQSRHARSGSAGAGAGNARRAPNARAAAAAQRLAHVMAHQAADDSDGEGEDDILYDYYSGGTAGRAARSCSPMVLNCRKM